MCLRIRILVLIIVLMVGCAGEVSPEQEVYEYITGNLSLSEKQHDVFILQNPKTVCGGCINTGNTISQKHTSIPTITTLERKRLVRSENCIIDTTGRLFDLLPSTLLSYVLFKDDENLSFILLEQKNYALIESKIVELGLD